MRWAWLAAALTLAPMPALAQDAAPADTDATTTVGPRELQKFSLQGTVTRPAEPAPAADTAATPAPASRSPAQNEAAATPRPQAASSSSAAEDRAATASREAPSATVSNSPAREAVAQRAAAEPLQQSRAGSSVTVALPHLDDGVVSSSATAPATADFSSEAEAAPTLAPQHGFGLLPWLLAALALGGGAGFLFWRNRDRPLLAGGPQFDAFAAPDPMPAPRAAPRPAPAPAPRPAPAPAPRPAPTRAPETGRAPSPAGIVSTRLRPWVEIGFKPLRCIVDDAQVTVEFELELFNSGSAPARAVLVEATLFNASNHQDSELETFFSNPVGEGERIVAIQPLNKVTLRTQVAAPRASVQAYEVGGRQVFIPIIAFNALYRSSNSEGQTSTSYLLGRDSKTDKLAPFRLDLGPRVFRGLGARLLPNGVRK